MSSLSIYNDLQTSDLGEKVEKLKEQNEKLFNHVKILQEDVEKLCKELTKMKKTEDNLKRNISSLYTTSKVEIERKDKMILDLRKQLDDLLFKRSGVYSNRKWSAKNIPSKSSNVCKRSSDISEPDPPTNKRQKCELQDDSQTQIIKSQQKTYKLENNHQLKGDESNKNSKSSRREKSFSRHRNTLRDKKRSRSRSKDKHYNRSRSGSRDEDRNRSRYNNKSRDQIKINNVSDGKDLREILSSRRLKGEANHGNDKNCNIVVKEALNRLSNKHNRHLSSESTSNSKHSSDTENCEKSRSNGEVIETRSSVKKHQGRSFSNENKTIQRVTEMEYTNPENLATNNQPSNYEDPKKCVSTSINLEDTQNAELTSKFVDHSFPTRIEGNSQTTTDNTGNKETNNIPNNISFSDKKLDVIHTSKESQLLPTTGFQTGNIEMTSDTKEGLINGQLNNNIANSNINTSRTSINVFRRRRCVIKIVS